MSAIFNSSKAPPQTGPKSIRMSSNASVLFPIREEDGVKANYDEIISSSPKSSLSSKLLVFHLKL